MDTRNRPYLLEFCRVEVLESCSVQIPSQGRFSLPWTVGSCLHGVQVSRQ